MRMEKERKCLRFAQSFEIEDKGTQNVSKAISTASLLLCSTSQGLEVRRYNGDSSGQGVSSAFFDRVISVL